MRIKGRCLYNRMRTVLSHNQCPDISTIIVIMQPNVSVQMREMCHHYIFLAQLYDSILYHVQLRFLFFLKTSSSQTKRPGQLMFCSGSPRHCQLIYGGTMFCPLLNFTPLPTSPVPPPYHKFFMKSLVPATCYELDPFLELSSN